MKKVIKLKIILEVLLLGCVVLILGIALHSYLPGGTVSSHLDAYPPPATDTSPASPPPGDKGNNIPATLPLATLTPTPLRDLKDGHIFSPAEIGAMATFAYKKSHLPTMDPNRLYPTKSTFPIKSLADIPEVVYRDPFYGSDETGFGDCIHARNPGSAVLVHPINGKPNYYIVPFYKDHLLCALALVEIRDGAGFASGMGQGFGDKFPYGNADEAIQQVEKITGKQVVSKPVLVFGAFVETGDPFNPIWQVTIEDNQIYYVVFITGIFEGHDLPETTITVYRADEIHPIE